MKQVIMIFAMALMVIACGKNSKEGGEVENAQSNKEQKATASTSNADPQSDEYIISRVQAIYDDVFSEYNKITENETIPQTSPDEKYCSNDWNEVLLKVSEYDQLHNPDEIGFFDGDYWVMGQDCGDLSVSDIKLLSHDGEKAVVEFNLHNMGESSPIQLDMKFERGDWFIDDFIEMEENYDWKEEMKDYLK